MSKNSLVSKMISVSYFLGYLAVYFVGFFVLGKVLSMALNYYLDN